MTQLQLRSFIAHSLEAEFAGETWKFAALQDGGLKLSAHFVGGERVCERYAVFEVCK